MIEWWSSTVISHQPIRIVNQITTTGGGITEILAVVGVVLAALSLFWQAIQYRLGGPSLKSNILRGYTDGTNLVSGSVDNDQEDLMSKQGLTTKLLGMEIINKGRMSISIRHASALTESGVRLSHPASPLNPPSEFRLEPHSSNTWWVELSDVEKAVSADSVVRSEWRGRSQKVRMTAKPGAGKDITTKGFLLVAPKQRG